ncbi:hypothetical protein OPQ81_005543 [Rhizoctonia solani]|nr:hypothetical protein OPQ81_005543 [Rhizoctonia solani]
MSRNMSPFADDPTQEYNSQLHTNPISNVLEQTSPPLQPFPTRNRVAPSGNGGFPERSGLIRDAELQVRPGFGTIDNPYHPSARGSITTQTSRQGPQGPVLIQGLHSSALPTFTPFPAAAPSSRYAPPQGPRVEPARPVLPPILNSEGVRRDRWASERPANLVGESSTPMISYLR